MLQERALGATPLRVTTLGLGGAALGNLYAPVSESEAAAAVRAALAAGVRYFDVAPLYGYGLSERRVGAALREVPRTEFLLSTKVGRRLVPEDPANWEAGQFPESLPNRVVFDYSYDGALRSIDESLERLRLDRIDIALIHDIDTWTHGSAAAAGERLVQAMAGAYPALCRLKAEGVIAAIGLGVNEWQACERFAQVADVDCFLLAGRYTLLEQTALETFLPLCARRKISVIVGGPYNTGILASGAVAGAHYNYEPAPPEILARVAAIEHACRRHGVPLAAAALQFPLGHPSVASVIPGARSAAEVHRNVELMSTDIPAALWEELLASGLLSPDAPVPAGGAAS